MNIASKKNWYLLFLVIILQPLLLISLMNMVVNQQSATTDLVITALSQKSVIQTKEFLDKEPKYVTEITGFKTREAYDDAVKGVDADLIASKDAVKELMTGTHAYILYAVILAFLLSNFLAIKLLFRFKTFNFYTKKEIL